MVRITTLKLIFAIALLSLGWTGTAEAVQRSFVNLGFEQPVLPRDKNVCPKASVGSALMPISDVDGWSTTHDPADPWCTNNGGTTDFESTNTLVPLIDIWKSGQVFTPSGYLVSAEGAQHAELSTWQASRLYQTVCLIQGEVVDWEFSHTHRTIAAETMEFSISNSDGVKLQTITTATSSDTTAGSGTCGTGTCNAPQLITGAAQPDGNSSPLRNPWTKHSGTFTWTGQTGNQQFGFETLHPLGSHEGNLLDAIQLNGLKPFVELSQTQYFSVEGVTDNVSVRARPPVNIG